MPRYCMRDYFHDPLPDRQLVRPPHRITIKFGQYKHTNRNRYRACLASEILYRDALLNDPAVLFVAYGQVSRKRMDETHIIEHRILVRVILCSQFYKLADK